MERKQAGLWQPQRHVYAFHCRENQGQDPAELSESTPQEWLVARESVWLLSALWNAIYGIHCQAVAREVSRTEYQPLNHLLGPDQGLWHNWLWKIMHRFECPDRLITLVRQFLDGILTRVQDDGESSQPFPVMKSVRQGCVMTPPYSAWCSQLFRQMPSMMVILELPIGTSLMGSFSTFGDCRQTPACRSMSSMTFSLQVTVHLMLEPSPKCRRAWIWYLQPAKTLALQ